MDPHPGPSHFHLRSLYGNLCSKRRQPSERTKIHGSSHPRRQCRVFPERFQIRPRRRFPILLRRTARRFLPPSGRILHPLFAPVARRALLCRYPHPQRVVAPPPLPRRGPPLGIQHHPRFLPRRLSPRRRLQQLQPRIHAPAPPHHPLREVLQRIPRLSRAAPHRPEVNTTRASCGDGSPLGEGFNNSSPVFMRLHRRITLFEKSYKESLADLRTLQEARLAASEAPARATEEELTYPGPTTFVFGDLTPPPAPATPAGSPASPEIGFVPESTESLGQAHSPALPLDPPNPNPLTPDWLCSSNHPSVL